MEYAVGLTIEQIAEAFSGHRFTEVYPHLADDVRWTLVGDRTFAGKAAVTAMCEESAAYLATVTTGFSRFKVVVGEDSVVVDSRASYADSDGSVSSIASCDIYEFVDGSLSEITSYTVELS
jgi:SnoaL-like domain